jgi:predicted sugar kinase
MIPIGQPRYPVIITGPVTPRSRHVEIACGQRLSAMSLDSSRIVSREDGIYTAGEIVVAIDTGVTVTATLLDEPGRVDLIEHQASRALLLRHGVGLMRAAFGVNDGLRIEVAVRRHVPHCGLGTSSLMVAVASIAMNELYGRPMPDDVLARYLAQNHGEEFAGTTDALLPVQCLGGSGVANLYEGAIQVLAGQTTVIGTMVVPDRYRVVIGIPADHDAAALDAAALMAAEASQAGGFAATGRNHATQVAYDLVHEGLPGMVRGDLTGIGRIVFNHRFEWGSIRNCAFSHPRLLAIADGVRHLWADGTVSLLGLSSAGPAFYAITDDVDPAIRTFGEQGMETFTAPLFNGRYQVVDRDRRNGLALREDTPQLRNLRVR